MGITQILDLDKMQMRFSGYRRGLRCCIYNKLQGDVAVLQSIPCGTRAQTMKTSSSLSDKQPGDRWLQGWLMEQIRDLKAVFAISLRVPKCLPCSKDHIVTLT